ncbi:MAG: hypothetical protein KA296_14550 [Marinobacter sp.]|nr:hypothetical protein [Marinobacter sp.]
MESTPRKKRFRIALLASAEGEREELIDALQVNSLGHELLIFENPDQLFEALHAGGNTSLPNLLMIALDDSNWSSADVLARVKQTPTIKAIPVIVFYRQSTSPNTPELYRLGAASVIHMPLRFEGLIQIVRVMEDYWFNVTSPLSV